MEGRCKTPGIKDRTFGPRKGTIQRATAQYLTHVVQHGQARNIGRGQAGFLDTT